MIAAPATYCTEAPLIYKRPEKGASEAAELLAKKLEEFCAHYSEPRRQILEPEIMSLVNPDFADSETVPVTTDTANQALTFALLLPRSLPIPEVAADPDGEISFDWIGNAGKMFSVSVGANGRVSYAGRFSDVRKTHGIWQVSGSCPREILVGIEEALS